MDIIGMYVIFGVLFATASIGWGIITPGTNQQHPILTPVLVIMLWPLWLLVMLVVLTSRRP